MINRRRPIQSIVENRRMFAVGGMAQPMGPPAQQMPMGMPPAQPMPMGMPPAQPMPMGMPPAQPMGPPPQQMAMGMPPAQPMAPPPQPMAPPPQPMAMGMPPAQPMAPPAQPMAPPPQPMPMENDPVGILASSNELSAAASSRKSPPMLDSLVGDIAAQYEPAQMAKLVQSGAPLSMAQGGLASEEMARGYRHGGVHYGQNPNRPARPLGSPRPRPERKPEGYAPFMGKILPIEGVSGIGKSWSNEPGSGESSEPSSTSFINRYGPDYTVGDGYSAPDSSSIKSIKGSLTQDLDVAVPVVDPSFESKGRMLLGDLVKESYNKTRERWMGSSPQGDRKPDESRVAAFSKGIGFSVADAAGDIFNDLGNSLKSLFSADFANKYPDMDLGMLASSIDRMQKAHPDFKDEIADLSEKFIRENNPLLKTEYKGPGKESAAENLQNLVLKSLSNKYELATHQDRIINANDEAKAFLETDIGQGFASAEGGAREEELAAAAEADRSIGDLDTVGGDRSLYTVGDTSLTASQLQTLALDAGDEEGFEGSVITDPVGGVTTVDEARYAPLPPTRPGGDGAGDGAADGAAVKAASVLDTEKKADKTSLAAFKEEFLAAMPEYEGMSESEKGFLIMEAGLRVMAGKSPNAIENIAEGLKGLGPALAKGAKEKRDWNRQIQLSAAKYGLENVARDAAEDRSDERKVFFFYDQTKKTKDNPYGPMVTVSMADIVANGGKIPEGLVEKDLVSKSIASANASTARLQKLITDNAKVYRIGATEAAKLEEDLDVARTSFVSGEIGINLLATVKAQVAGDKITGFGNAGKELYRRAFESVGLDVDKKYKDVSSARADIRRAFQSLIPLSLGSTQSANSISNRDVKFLADAYIDSGFLKDGVLSFATVDSAALGKQLDGAIGKFRESQKRGLATYSKVLQRISSAEEGLAGARALGVPVSPGPFGRKYFQSTIEGISPYAESTKARLEGSRVKPMFTQKSFGALKGFDFIDGKYVPEKPKVN